MPAFNLNSLLTNFSKLLLLALFLGIALAFNPYGFNLFVLPKLYLLLNLVLLLLAITVFSLSQGTYLKLPPFKITMSLTLFFFLAALATFASITPQISLLGKMPRYEGLITWLAYLILFFLVFTLFKDSDLTALFWLIVSLVLITSVYALFQFLELDFIKWNQNFALRRVWATFGNATTFGAFLVLVLPIIFSYLTAAPQKRCKWLVLLTFMLGILSLLLTRSRSAWLGFLVGFAWLLFSKEQVKVKKYSLLFMFTLLILAFFMLSIKIEHQRQTASGRIILWQQSVKLITARPVLGWGPETFQFAFPPYISKEYEQKVSRKTIIDNAHNLFLHSAASFGLPATVVLMLAFFFIFKQLALSQNFFNKGIASGYLSYLVALQFHFSTVAVSPFFWFLAAVGLSLTTPNSPEKKRKRYQKKRFLFIAPAIALVFIWLSTSFFLGRMVIADVHFRQALTASSSGRFNSAYINFLSSQQLQPWEPYYPLTSGQVFLEISRKLKSKLFLAIAKEQFLRAYKLNKYEEYALLGLGDTEYTGWQLFKKRDSLKKALIYYQRLIKHDPNFRQVRIKISRLKKSQL